MSRPYYSVKHVESMSLLPAKLTRGRAYFVDDEQVIVIDHGNGPVTYGGKPGPQGQAGEPLPMLQDQIDELAEASLKVQKFLWDESNKSREAHTRLEHQVTEGRDFLQEQVDMASSAILRLAGVVKEEAEKNDAAIAILAKSISELYPDTFRPGGGDEDADPLDNETITTPAGTWTIQQTTLKDGTIILNLEAQELFIETLTVGQAVDFDGSTWKVQDYERDEDGTIRLTITP